MLSIDLMDNQHSPSQDHFWKLLSKKLSGKASSSELQEIHLILINNPDLQYQADLMTEMWQQEPKTEETESEAAYLRHIMKHKDEFFAIENPDELHQTLTAIEELPTRPVFIFTRRKLTVPSIAAMFVLAVISVYLFSKTKRSDIASVRNGVSSIATKNGNRTKIVLPDGSQVWLNAGSNLNYNHSDFNKRLREVSLNGEAYFDVTKNADIPFIIHTKKMDIKVIGTAFNVRSYRDEKFAEASLIRGSIEVTLKDRKDQKIILKPNEKISVANKEEESIQVSIPGKKTIEKNTVQPIPQIVVKELKPNPTYNIIGEIAWTQNKLYFEDVTLEEIILLIERWFGKKVVIRNESLKKVRYTGNFENETMEEVLSYLKLSNSFNFRIENDTVVIY